MPISADDSETRHRTNKAVVFGLLLIGVSLALVLVTYTPASARILAAATGARPQRPSSQDTPTPTSTPSCTPAWSVVSSPNVGSGPNYLYAVAAISPNDVWAVGYYGQYGVDSRT